MEIIAKIRKIETTVFLQSDIKTVWNVVTNNYDFDWRSDLERVEVIEDTIFIEHTVDKKWTRFVITKKEPYTSYEFHMENDFFNGQWIGTFSELSKGGTQFTLSENIVVKNPFLRILSYFFWDLKKIQDIYISDLKKKLQEQ